MKYHDKNQISNFNIMRKKRNKSIKFESFFTIPQINQCFQWLHKPINLYTSINRDNWEKINRILNIFGRMTFCFLSQRLTLLNSGQEGRRLTLRRAEIPCERSLLVNELSALRCMYKYLIRSPWHKRTQHYSCLTGQWCVTHYQLS